MLTILFAFMFVVLGGVSLKVLENVLKSRNSLPKFDVKRVRELEMEIWGYHFTPAPETKALPKPSERPRPRLETGIKLQVPDAYRIPTCVHCGLKTTTGIDLCNRCELNDIKAKTKELKEKLPRQRDIVHEGMLYRAQIPSEVPDNAHVEIMQTYKHGDFYGTWAAWKWTDQKTGRQMGLRSVARLVKPFVTTEQFEIMSDQSSKPIRRLVVEEPVYDWVSK